MIKIILLFAIKLKYFKKLLFNIINYLNINLFFLFLIFINIFMGIGDWGLGIGDWEQSNR